MVSCKLIIIIIIIIIFSSGRRQMAADENILYIFSYFQGLEVIAFPNTLITFESLNNFRNFVCLRE